MVTCAIQLPLSIGSCVSRARACDSTTPRWSAPRRADCGFAYACSGRVGRGLRGVADCCGGDGRYGATLLLLRLAQVRPPAGQATTKLSAYPALAAPPRTGQTSRGPFGLGSSGPCWVCVCIGGLRLCSSVCCWLIAATFSLLFANVWLAS